MYPEIIRIGNFVISSFGVMMVVAFLVNNYLLRKDMKHFGQNPDIADEITFRAAIGGVLGAKVYYLIENIPSGRALDNLQGLWNILAGIFTLNGGRITDGLHNFGAGMVFYGGLIGGLILVTLFIRKQKLEWLTVSDWVAPYLVLGHGIGSIGCFLVGDDYGIPSNLPWAIAFPKGAPPTTIPVHPTQVYEMLAYFLIFGYLYRKRLQKAFNGEILFKYFILAGIVRFFVEFLRTNNRYFLNLSGAQFISIILIVIGGYHMWKNFSKK